MQLLRHYARRIVKTLKSEPPHRYGISPLIATKSEQALIEHVQQSIAAAQQKKCDNITKELLLLEGKSSPKGRMLLNHLCSLPDASYLEVGVWKGSTFVSALHGNTQLKDAVAIDDWSEFTGPKEEFLQNVASFLPTHKPRIYSQDCFHMDLAKTFPHLVDIYFYDGNHSPLSHEQAFTYFNPIFADTFIAIVDDWNWAGVRRGTWNAFKKLKYQVLFEEALPSAFNGDCEQWWNGCYVAIIRKS